MTTSFQLIFAGIIDQKKDNQKRQAVKYRDNRQQPVHRVAFHLLQKSHDILLRQRKDDIKAIIEISREKKPVRFLFGSVCCSA